MSRLITAIAAVIVVALIGCGDGGDGATAGSGFTPDELDPGVGSTGWGSDDCLYKFIGGGLYKPTSICRTREDSGSITYYDESDPDTVLYREGDGYFSYVYNGLLARRPTVDYRSPAIEVYDQGRWMPVSEYAYLQTRGQEFRDQKERQRVADAQKEKLRQELQAEDTRLVNLILAPPCNPNYDGCA